MTLGTLAPAALAIGLTMSATAATPLASELQPRTSTAFDRYAGETEKQAADSLTGESRFLWVDNQADRRARLETLRAGGLLIERLETKVSGKSIDVPGGMIHHWLGAVFVPGASLDKAVHLLQDYEHHADIYSPNVARSRLVSSDGETFHVFLRFFMKKVLTVVVNSEHEARFTRASPTRAYSRIVSTRINEVEDPDTPKERELPAGRDGGYLWRLNSYWRFMERDGGTYIQCESITLSRGIPLGLGWLIGPFVTSIPKDTLTFTLETTRRQLSH